MDYIVSMPVNTKEELRQAAILQSLEEHPKTAYQLAEEQHVHYITIIKSLSAMQERGDVVVVEKQGRTHVYGLGYDNAPDRVLRVPGPNGLLPVGEMFVGPVASNNLARLGSTIRGIISYALLAELARASGNEFEQSRWAEPSLAVMSKLRRGADVLRQFASMLEVLPMLPMWEDGESVTRWGWEPSAEMIADMERWAGEWWHKEYGDKST